jgi:hypothetical protein
MDNSLIQTDATETERLACSSVVELLESRDRVDDADAGTIDELVGHVETCAACRAVLDKLYPEQPLPPLTERVPPEAAALLAEMPGDAQTATEVAAWLLIEGRHSAEPVHETPPRSCEVVVLAETRKRLRTAALPQDDCRRDQFAGQFLPGQVLRGAAGEYVIKAGKKATDCCETYEAVVQGYLAGSEVQAQSRVIIRIPRVTVDMSNEGAAARLVLLANLLRATMMTQRRLAGSEHVAQLVDQGDYDHRLSVVRLRSRSTVTSTVRTSCDS